MPILMPIEGRNGSRPDGHAVPVRIQRRSQTEPVGARGLSGNAVSGVTRIEGSNPSRSAKNPCTVRLLGTRPLRLRDAIGQITAPDLTPTMTPSLCSANVGGRPWTGYRISAQSAALDDQPDECGHVVPPECSQTAPAALDPCVFEANGVRIGHVWHQRVGRDRAQPA
jgi:hypothetical protein